MASLKRILDTSASNGVQKRQKTFEVAASAEISPHHSLEDEAAADLVLNFQLHAPDPKELPTNIEVEDLHSKYELQTSKQNSKPASASELGDTPQQSFHVTPNDQDSKDGFTQGAFDEEEDGHDE